MFWTVFTCKQCLIYAYFSLDSDKTTFSQEKAILWIEGSYFSWKKWVEVEKKNEQSFLKLIDGLELCGLLMDYLNAFISSLVSHSAENPLMSKMMQC